MIIPFCAECGYSVTTTARFCRNCGASQAVEPIPPPPADKALPAQDTACTSCGSPLLPDEKFCGTCGTKTKVSPLKVPASAPTCSSCGAMLDAGARFCDSCGRAAYAEQTPPSPPPGRTEGTVPQPPSPARPRFCGNCGTRVSPTTKFCGNCGAPQGPSSPAGR